LETLNREEAISVLKRQLVAHLGVVIDGKPYVTPMSFVIDEERILFRTMAGKKLEGLRANASVCIEASEFDADTGKWESVIVQGFARLVDDEASRQETVRLLYEKYEKVMGSPLSATGLAPLGGYPYVIEVPLDHVTGMTSGSGLSVRTKPGRM
jgi:nitroimidazol reductase NimA-like FMN-containing flavoprotein (pyridoxamine 5'-phosphate oxidase superfamily)